VKHTIPGCPDIPPCSLTKVLPNAESFVETIAEIVLGIWISAFGCGPEPARRSLWVLRDADSVAIPHRKIVLRDFMAGCGRFAIPVHREAGVLSDSAIKFVAGPQVELCADMPLLSRFLPKRNRLLPVPALLNSAECMTISQAELRLSITVFGEPR